MFGIIATIVAAVKGHKTFAWFTGIWTALAVIVAFSGGAQYAIAPGGLFLVIALFMKKIPEDSGGEDGIEINAAAIDPKEKFICTSCGYNSSGWYQLCPKCGLAGTMKLTAEVMKKTASSASSTVPPRPEAETKAATIENRSISAVKFCRECGHTLKPEAKFCPQCGLKIEAPAPLQLADAAPVPENTEVVRSEALAEPPQDKAPAPSRPIPDILSLPPILRRAFLLVEDEEWEKADSYFEKVLDEEPENPYAYLGKLMIEKRVAHFEQIPCQEEELSDSKNYKRAVQYADEQLKQFLCPETEKTTPDSEPSLVGKSAPSPRLYIDYRHYD